MLTADIGCVSGCVENTRSEVPEPAVILTNTFMGRWGWCGWRATTKTQKPKSPLPPTSGLTNFSKRLNEIAS